MEDKKNSGYSPIIVFVAVQAQKSQVHKWHNCIYFSRCSSIFISTEKLDQVLLVTPYLVEKEVTSLTRISVQTFIYFLFQLQMLCILGIGRLIHHVLFHYFIETIFGLLRVFLMLLNQGITTKFAPEKKSTKREKIIHIKNVQL